MFIDPDKWGVFDGSKNVALAIDAGGTGADTVDGALKNLGLDTALADKQTKDTTLTALSGKTVAQLLAYLTLGPIASAADITAGTANKLIDAYGLNAYFPARGFSAYGYIRIPNQPGGLILQWGQVPPIPAGGSLIVNYTMAFPGGFLTVIPMAGSSPAAANAVLAAGGGDSKSSFQVFNSLPGVTHETGSGIYLALGF
ncbi:gp53-like domain-containing protein [Citrobacter freundii]